MNVHLAIRNESDWKAPCRRDTLERLAERVCAGENVDGAVEVSLLLCGDAFIRTLNRDYRGQDRATDVLSFTQEDVSEASPRPLGDIVISLDTVTRNAGRSLDAVRGETLLLFCHGLLHLLGYTHKNERACARMAAKQAAYLGISLEEAWPAISGPARPKTLGR